MKICQQLIHNEKIKVKMILSCRYLCRIQNNILFKYVLKRCTLPIHRYANLECTNFKNMFGTSSQAFRMRYEIPKSEMSMCNMKNGMQLVCEYKNSYTTTIGCFLPAGPVYEMPEERGSALFLEHLLFKRTANRSQEQLEKYLAEFGGTINTILTRDLFLFYGVAPCYNIEKLIELFADVIMNGIICEEDVLAEKCIVLKELEEIESDTEKVVMDYLMDIAYQETPLAKSVYPETKVIKKFSTESLLNFRNRIFKTCYMTIVSIGATTLQQLEDMACRYFSTEIEDCKCVSELYSVNSMEKKLEYRFTGSELRLRDDSYEIGHVAVAVEGPRSNERDDHAAFTVAQKIISSWDRSHGGANHNAPYLAHCAFNTDLCHMYKSFFINWTHTSIWGSYFVTDKLSLEIMLSMLQNEWMRLCTTITCKEVSRAVNQCQMHELITLYEPLDHLYDIVNYLFRCGYYEPMQKRLERYKNVTPDKIREVTDKYIYDQSPAVVAFGRIENLPDYVNICNGMYLLQY